MLDFRLRVFYTVAKLLNFTRAAALLHISQPAVTKHIKELEQHYKVTLFDRQPNALALTEAGQILYRHALHIMEEYELLDFDMNALLNRLAGDLHMGASTTISQYILPTLLAGFHQRYPDVHVYLANENSNRILQLLLQKEIDVALVEGNTNNSNVQFSSFLQDELVLVCSSGNKLAKKGQLKVSDLSKLPFIMREGDSGTYEIIENALKAAGLPMERLHINMHLATTEGIKAFVEMSEHFAFVSIHAVAKELTRNSLRIVDVEGLEIKRMLHIALRQGQPLPIVEPFLKYLHQQHTHNQ